MRTIMVMYDSLIRGLLEPYGGTIVKTPNFSRLQSHAVQFENAFICSAACMPARRELHTGRPNFLDRSWGPIEPYDDSMPEILKKNGIRSHLISDHYHYWEDGGATYHNRYSSWEIVRGQEGDSWKTNLTPFEIVTNPQRQDSTNRQDNVNRMALTEPPQTTTFDLGLEFLEKNVTCDNWFLQLETFDPHEPFCVPKEWLLQYPDSYDGPYIDWPPYADGVSDAGAERFRSCYYALLAMCDAHLGRILDFMDAHSMWEDTMLIVNTDHGYSLGEHGWFAKCVFPMWNEVSKIPLFIWDPREKAVGKRQSLVQSIDLAPTVLEFFGLPVPKDMAGVPLRNTVKHDASVRDAGLFGIFGGQVNITDGRYVYMRSERTHELYQYELIPTRHPCQGFAPLEELKTAQLAPPFSYTKGVPLVRTKSVQKAIGHTQNDWPDMLYDTLTDPGQLTPIDDPGITGAMSRRMAELMREYDTPAEQFERMEL